MAMSLSLGGTSLTLRSPIYSSPSDTSSSPAIIRRVVDFPQPDGPTRTTNSLSLISRFRSGTTVFPLSYVFTTCLNVISAIFVPPVLSLPTSGYYFCADTFATLSPAIMSKDTSSCIASFSSSILSTRISMLRSAILSLF